MREDSGGQPCTVWDLCQEWADVLVEVLLQTRALSREEHVVWMGEDRPLTVLVLAAALHEQVVSQRLEEAAPQEAAGVRLHTPGPGGDGVDRVLRYRPYAALATTPSGVPERDRLVEAAVSADPDRALLWQRIRTAALSVVECVTDVGHGTTITMCDVLLAQQRRAEFDRLGDLFDEV